MVDDIDLDKEFRTVTLIEIANKFRFLDNVVWLNLSEPGVTVLGDIDI
jgi:hypothetical protein